jgi:DNA replication initiation complex subunit (GINS family)
MSYKDLYAAWRWETTEASLGGLPPDFYIKIAAYMKRIHEDSGLDKKTVKVALLEHETKNVNRMLEELLKARYRKILKSITKNQRIPTEVLTTEEAAMSQTFAGFSDAYDKFSKGLIEGQATAPQITTPQPTATIAQANQDAPITVRLIESKPPEAPTKKRLTLRFTKPIPAIMGADMKSYGPFVAEDVASLPAVNAKMLVKQGLAVMIEVS